MRVQCARCKEWERLGLSAYCPPCDRAHFAADLAAKQEPLGKEFEQVLFGNLPELYAK